MLAGLIDRAVENLGRARARATGWQPEGQRVRLTMTEGMPGVFGSSRSGRIDRIVPPAIIVSLERAWPELAPAACSRLRLTPRYAGHSVWRLLLLASYVNVFCDDDGAAPDAARPIAICRMELDRGALS